MAEKTLAEIARAAWMSAGILEDHWEITAAAVRNAVIEDCAKICNQMAHERRELLFQTPEGSMSGIGLDMAQAALDNAAAAIRNLKDTPDGA
jgi:hypothetical protein